jgi:hypothetical protein
MLRHLRCLGWGPHARTRAKRRRRSERGCESACEACDVSKSASHFGCTCGPVNASPAQNENYDPLTGYQKFANEVCKGLADWDSDVLLAVHANV